MNLNSDIIGNSFAKVWKRKLECEQTKGTNTVQSRGFSAVEQLKEEDRANKNYLEHEITKTIRKEIGKSDLLIGDKQHEWALQNKTGPKDS